MKTFKFVPAFLTLSIVLGIVFGFYINLKPIFIAIFLSVAILILGISYYFSNKSFTKNSHFNFAAFLLFFVIGIAAVSFQNQRNYKNHYSNFISNENQTVLVIEKQLKSNIYYDKYEAKVFQINENKTLGKVLLNIKKDSLTQFNIEDKILISSNFKWISEPKNLYQFNYKNYLEKQQIHHQIHSKYSDLKVLKSKTSTLNGFASAFRKHINKSLKNNGYKNDELAIINALLLGQRQNMSKELIENYQNAGAVHILAVSGLHVGVLFLLLSFLLKPLEKFKKGELIKLVIVILLLWSYATIAGLSASVVRAVTMFTAIAIGQLSNRKSNTLNNLFISMFVLLLVKPLFLFSVGFQLSYLAVFSIVYFYPKFIDFYNPKSIFLKKPWQLFAISCSAQIGILPLSLYYFHQFPSLFFVSSLIIIPALGFILGFGILIIGLALLNILPQSIAVIYGNIIQLMNRFIEFIAKQESFLFTNISFSVLVLICSYLFIIFSFRFIDKKTIQRFAFVLIGIVLFQVVFIYQKQQLYTKSEFIIFNKNRGTLIANRFGENVKFHSDTTKVVSTKYIANNYLIGNGKLIASTENSVKDIYKIKNKKILILDSLGIYTIEKFKPEIILLTQSPKINLERLIQNLQPKIIIADASNYKSYVKFWSETCIKKNIKFHSTYQKGAYRITQ